MCVACYHPPSELGTAKFFWSGESPCTSEGAVCADVSTLLMYMGALLLTG